jgi:peroxiredoxin
MGLAHPSEPELCKLEATVRISGLMAAILTMASLLAGTPATAGAAAETPTPAADFTLPAIQGGNVRLSEYRGQVVVITFWSSRCAVCATQLAELNQLQKTYGSAGLVTLAVSVDSDTARAREYARLHAGLVPMLLDAERAVGRIYKVDRLPTTVLIDRRGQLRQTIRDYRRIDNSYISQLRVLLDDAPTARDRLGKQVNQVGLHS